MAFEAGCTREAQNQTLVSGMVVKRDRNGWGCKGGTCSREEKVDFVGVYLLVYGVDGLELALLYFAKRLAIGDFGGWKLSRGGKDEKPH